MTCSKRETVLREAAKELLICARAMCASLLAAGIESRVPHSWDAMQDAIAKMADVL